MTSRRNRILQTERLKNSSLLNRASVLCFAVLMLFSEDLFAQVISNTGAAISVAGAVVNSKDIENNSGILVNNGTINLSGNYLNANPGITNGNGSYFLSGNWTNFGLFNAGTSSVTLQGTADQNITHGSSGETFYTLTINNPGRFITQFSDAGSTLAILNNLNLNAGTLNPGPSTVKLTVGGRATIQGTLLFNDITPQTATIADVLSGTGSIDMSGGSLPHLLNLAGSTNAIGTFTTSPSGSSTVDYNGTDQTVFAASNYRNLIISNSGIKTLQGDSEVGIDLNISGGTFDLGTTTTTLGVIGSTSITGSLKFNGAMAKTVSLAGILDGTGSIDMSGGNLPHHLKLEGSTNNIGLYSSGNNSLVEYIRNGAQTLFTSDDYRNLTISGTGLKTLNADISAKGILTMSAGDIDANGNTLKITNPAIGAIVRTNGTVIGKLQRAIGYTASDYLYPIGSAVFYNPLKLTFQNLTAGPLTAQFRPEEIGIAGLPLDDDGNEIFDTDTTGYWSLTAVSPMASGDYNVKLNYNGFLAVDSSSSVIKRTDGGNLELDGIHGSLTASEISRTTLGKGISAATTDFAIGKGRPRITDQPSNIDICDGFDAFFEVKARGRGTLTYQWQVKVDFVSAFINISNVGVYSGADTRTLILTGAPYSMNGYVYRCIITDGQGSTNITNSVLLTVNKIPEATATPSSQDECPGVEFANIVLGTSNDVPGTTFTWTRDNPAGIVTSLPLNGFAAGDQIPGVFGNTTDSPVTVTFTITPRGPATTFCIGEEITATVTVNPVPRVFTIPATSIQCDSTTTNIRLTSPSTFTSGLITFKYTVSTTGTVTGFADTEGLPDNHYITDKLVNHTDTFRVVTYRVVPVSPVGCIDGPAQNAAVTVNPTPRATPVNIRPEICYGGKTEILLTTPTVMTSGVIKFDYTISLTGVPGDLSGNSFPAIDFVAGQKLTFSYTNSAPPSRIDTVSSVLFAITPKVVNMTGPGCNAGNIVTPEVKVHPKTIKYNYPGTNGTGIVITKPLTCDISSGLAALRIVVTRGADPYKISWTGPVGYTNDSVDIVNLNVGKYTVRVTDNLGCYNDSSINVVPFTARPQITATPVLPNIHVSCPGGSDGTIRVYVSSGITAPYFFWVIRNGVDTLPGYGVFTSNYNPSDPNTFRLINNLPAGSYMLVIRDVNGCIVPRVTELKEPAPIKVEFRKSDYNGFNVSCRGYSNGSALAIPSGGNGTYSYFWYPATGTLTVSNKTNLLDSIPAGKYYLRTTDLLNCTKVDSVIINEPEGMQLTSSELSLSPDGNTNISCYAGVDGFIEMNISGGSGVYNYLWSGPDGYTANTGNISGLRSGTYTCIVSDLNGCILTPSPSFTLTEPSALVVSSTSSVSVDGAFNINCNGGTGSVIISVAGGSPGSYTYTWSSADGSGIVAGQKDQYSLAAGTYHLVVKDLNNCIAEKDITLIQPPPFGINLTATNITCQSPGFNNGSIELTVSGGIAPYGYLWSNGAVTEDISELTQGYYRVTVSYNNSCIKTDSVYVDLPPPLTYTKELYEYNGYNISCYGLANGSINIEPTSGLAPFIFNWTGPDGFTATTEDISDLKSGQYTLLITDNNYCTVVETINLTQPGRLGMTFSLSESNAGGFNINCAGGSTGSIGIEPLNYVKSVEFLWADGIFGRTRNNLPAGDYNVIITDANNCHAGETVSLTEPDSMKIFFEVSPPFCPDKPDGEIRINVTGGVMGSGYSYKWSDNSTGMNISNILKGFYKVTVKDLNNCMVSDSVTIMPLNETCLVIPNAISPNDDLINDVWNIGMIELYPAMEIRIFNRWGETVWRSEKGYTRPWDGKSNGKPLPIDSYHYIIDLHNGTKPLVGNITIVR